MPERKSEIPQELEPPKAVKDPLVDAFFRLEKPEQVIQFYLTEATLLMAEPNNIYTPKKSLEIVFNKYLWPLCLLTFFYPDKIPVWKIALENINAAYIARAEN